MGMKKIINHLNRRSFRPYALPPEIKDVTKMPG